MKKIILTLLALLLIFSFVSCEKNESNSDKLNVVVTTFPYYDFVRNVVKDVDVNLTLLIDNGTDIHSYNPSINDIITLKEADLFIYGGGESEEWANDIIDKSNTIVLSLLDSLGINAKTEEVIEGMTEEHHNHEHEHEDEEILDEHIWLSLVNASYFVSVIRDSLSSVDSKNANQYFDNAENYIKELQALDKEYEEVISQAKITTLLFADRFPFRYLVDDYNLNYYAAFVGCSAETEASFETISFLINKVDELNLKNIFIIDASDENIANTVRNNSKDKNQEILVLNSIQSVTQKQIDNGTTYLSIMKDNLEVLKKALQ